MDSQGCHRLIEITRHDIGQGPKVLATHGIECKKKKTPCSSITVCYLFSIGSFQEGTPGENVRFFFSFTLSYYHELYQGLPQGEYCSDCTLIWHRCLLCCILIEINLALGSLFEKDSGVKVLV